MNSRRKAAIENRRASVTDNVGTPAGERLCLDGCGKTVTGKQIFVNDTCRKRWRRRKEKEAAAPAKPEGETK